MSGFDQRDGRQKFTPDPEEMQMVKKCMDDSFLTHSVPSMLGAFALIKVFHSQGYRTKFWFNTAAILSAGFAGRVAALSGCLKMTVEKYPEGSMATKLKEARGMRNRNREFDYTPSESQSHEPATDYETTARPPPPQGQNQQTYDDYRRKNREQYMSRRTASPPAPPRDAPAPPFLDQPPPNSTYNDPSTISSYSDPPSPYADHNLVSSSTLDEDQPMIIRRRKRVNIYGDEIED